MAIVLSFSSKVKPLTSTPGDKAIALGSPLLYASGDIIIDRNRPSWTRGGDPLDRCYGSRALVETWWAKLIALDAWRTEPGLWVLSSWILYVLGAQISARYGGLPRGLWWAIRLTYLIGIPYAALLIGAASPRLMGLNGLDWVRTLGIGVPLAIAVWLMIMMSWRRGIRDSVLNPPGRSMASSMNWLLAIVEAAGQQWHWAFYRNAAIRWWGLYYGTWAGVLLVITEWCGNPSIWRALRHPGHAGPILLRLILLIATAALYLVTPNWWLMWGLHTLTLLSTQARQSPFSQHKRPTS